MFSSPPSEREARSYYAGLPSSPVLVAPTGSIPWKKPTGRWAYDVIRELRPVGDHALKEVWEGNLALKLHDLLDSMGVQWTSTDVVRIGKEEETLAPIVIWIGIRPGSLSGYDGLDVASKCRNILVEHDIVDIEVEIRESKVTRSAGPDIREPLTTSLGLPICAQSTPGVEGTGGFFITEGGNNSRILLVTTRHVVLPPDESNNEHFECKGPGRHCNVSLFGLSAFNNYLGSIQDEIRGKGFMAQYSERRIREVEGKDTAEAKKQLEGVQCELGQAKKAVEKLEPFYQEVSTRWAALESRVIGHVVLSPPINPGVGGSGEGYTEDWAVVEIDASKIGADNFDGNAIDLGHRSCPGKFHQMMNPNPQDPPSFEYPFDCLLRLQGTISDDEMRHPIAFDQNGEPYVMVIKRGNARAGLTVGRANDYFSYTRIYDNDGEAKTSKEWAILPFDSKSGAFSANCDSGSVIVDGRGHIGGLTSGAGTSVSSKTDITYATPITFLLKRMEEAGLQKPNINPALTV